MLAYIDLIKDIKPIAGADRIELAQLGNWQCVVSKGKFKPGDKAVYISIDTILPDNAEWAKFYKSKASRVKSARFKGVWSQGIAESLEVVGIKEDLEVGTDIQERIGVVKWEAAITQNLNARRNLPHGIMKTDEENFRSLDWPIPYGEKIIVTKKRDGSSASFYCKLLDNQWDTGATSRSLDLKLDAVNPWTTINNKLGILDKIQAYCEKNNVSLCFRAELTGNSLNASKPNHYSRLQLDIAFFNILDLSNLKYLPFSECEKVCLEIGLPVVEILERDVVLTPELISKYEDMEKLDENYFEGVVVKLNDGKSFKILNRMYDSLK